MIDGLVNREKEQTDVYPDDPALREKILVPGHLLEAEPRADGCTQHAPHADGSGDHAPRLVVLRRGAAISAAGPALKASRDQC